MIEQRELLTISGLEIYIFDMDGTLYELDGDEGSFSGSSLMNRVIANSIDFVSQKEDCGLYKARKIIEEAMRDKVGISNVLSQKYGITRQDVFGNTWNIDPKNIIKQSSDATNTILKLKQSNKRLFLLTGAPKIWMNNVLNELNLTSIFERKISGENFQRKEEIFESLVNEFEPDSMISIGDQIQTDIIPAAKFGINTFLVTKPGDLLKLI